MVSLLVLFAVLAIAVSFLCSLWEAVLLSIAPSYARLRYQEGSALGRHLKAFKDEIDRPLAAILTLNTIAHTVGAIGVGNQAAVLWADSSPWITRFAIPIGMTLAILVLSELIPKTLGALFWKPLVPFTVTSLRIAMFVLGPLVWLSAKLTGMLRPEGQGSMLSRSDFLAMAEIGAQEGVFERSESEIIANLLRFHRVRAKDIMTPRTVVVMASEDTTIRSYYDASESLPFSRIPTHEPGATDHVTGYVLKDDLLAALVEEKGDEPLRAIRRDVLVVDEGSPLPDLFNRFVEEREHIAMVADPFGGMSGIVTMEDVIETLLGLEIVDELDHAEDMQVLARQNWERRARGLGLDVGAQPAGASGPATAPAPGGERGPADAGTDGEGAS